MSIAVNERTEWLEADGFGGFAMGTTRGIRTRRYHGLLLSAIAPPGQRFMLVNGVDAYLRTPEGEFPLSFHRYRPGVTSESPRVVIERFEAEPWPRWIYRLSDGTQIEHEICVVKDQRQTILRWRLLSPQHGVRLVVRQLLSGRDYHALHRENQAFRFKSEVADQVVRWSPYHGVPTIACCHNGSYTHDPVWYRNFQYDEERARGMEFVEDLASPGVIEFDLSAQDASLSLVCETTTRGDRECDCSKVLEIERRRRESFVTPLERAADAYLVARGEGTTIIAGYPWFGDWGRDTFIAMRGLCIATGRLDEALQILSSWASTDSRGVLPNRFADEGGTPEYNSVDASLWFIIAACELMREYQSAGRPLDEANARTLRDAILRIISGFAAGTHHGIKLDSDGLLAAGEPGVQLTWMDARVGSRVITPRVGKPVEVQALWLNALHIASQWDSQWNAVFERGKATFERRFWNETEQCLYDVIDVDHAPGVCDASIRPNQIFAVGGLPLCLLSPERARAVVDRVEKELVTPLGLRSLAPTHPEYIGEYVGDAAKRDGSYHQGTVWPWLLGPFVEAWLRVRGNSSAQRARAQRQFVAPVLKHLSNAGIGHVSEIADGNAPHTPNGCPFQAWSLGELIRLERRVLCDPTRSAKATTRVIARSQPLSRTSASSVS